MIDLGTVEGVSSDAADPRRILIVRNPRAGSGTRYERYLEFVDGLSAEGFEVEQFTEIEALTDRCRTLLPTGELRTVVAAGGDGTAELVTNEIPHGVALTIFPLGTENLLAKYLGMDLPAADVVSAISKGRIERLDAARLRLADGSSRLFLLMLGCGFDADVIRRLHDQRTGNITHLSYAKPILDSVRKYRYPLLTISCWSPELGDAPQVVRAHWAFVFNTPSYAIGLAICPDADPRDNRLDMISFHGGSFIQGLKHIATVLFRRQRRSRSVEHVRASRIRIESDEPVPFQVDGDPGGMLPVEVTLEPERLWVVVPESWDLNEANSASSYSQTELDSAN